MKKSIILLFGLLTVFGCKKEAAPPLTDILLTLDQSGEGTFDIQSGVFPLGQEISITATAASGFYFDRWEGSLSSENNPLVFTPEVDTYLKAIFEPIPELSENVVLYTPKKMDENHVFMIENGGRAAYIVDKTGAKIKQWSFNLNLGNDLELLPDGGVMGLFKPETLPPFNFGGYGGVLRRYDSNYNLTWEYALHDENELLHHDFSILPNGNVMVLVWERIAAAEAVANGVERTSDLFTEKIIEIDPTNNTIVWQWRSWEHGVQDVNPDALNYGELHENFNRINLNYDQRANGDIMHANALAYDAERDLIYMSVNFYSEVWVIDHSISTQQARTSAGDLKYRFGNPTAYNGTGTRLFYNNHHPNFINPAYGAVGDMMIYNNGTPQEKSVVYELDLPDTFVENGTLVPPTVVWSFEDPELYFNLISGAVRLPNGNTLICEGDWGYWEVTPAKEVVWQYKGRSWFWRGYTVAN